MEMKSGEIYGKRIMCEDLEVGKVKEIIIDSDLWRITHFEVELTKDAAELVLGVRKGGIRNLLAVSAVGEVNQAVTLKVSKGQLRIYLIPPKLKS
jgi:sporulation protein YlmC with PRC-barrel domain